MQIMKSIILFSWQLCLLAKCLKPALPYLDTDITDIHKEVHNFERFDLKIFLCTELADIYM